MSKLKFGSDPEFFAVTRTEDGVAHVIPPVLFRTELGIGVKENENHPIFAEYGDTFVHEDGAAFEMSTPPSENWMSIWQTLHEAREQFGRDVLSIFPEVCLPHLYSLPTVHYQVERWLNKGPEFYLSTVFGCDADEDVYNTKGAQGVIDASLHNERYGGGHIHVSGLKEIQEKPLKAVRSMVMTAGLAATAFTDTPDLDKKRVTLYGRPGKYRIQNYKDGTVGIEYRTPSNRWTENYALAEKIFKWAEIGMNCLLRDGLLDEIAKKVEKDAAKAISKFDQKSAGEILRFIETKI